MKSLFALFLSLLCCAAFAQSRPAASVTAQALSDTAIQSRLIALALQNPAYKQVEAMAMGAKYQMKSAKSTWLNSMVVSGNINEFVVNNTTINGIPASTLFPKYNIGLNVPLGIFARKDGKVAAEAYKSMEAQKELQERQLKREVLVRYENYKEKKELLEFQKQITESQYRAYQQVQASYASAEVAQMEDVDKNYEKWIDQRSKQRTRERDLKLAELDLEEIIGVPLAEVLVPNFKKP